MTSRLEVANGVTKTRSDDKSSTSLKLEMLTARVNTLNMKRNHDIVFNYITLIVHTVAAGSLLAMTIALFNIYDELRIS
jgi:hypothetical protein